MSQTRHILVTGAGGFIGQRLAHALEHDPRFADCRITLTDIRIGRPPVGDRFRVVEGDLGQDAVREEALTERADLIFHLAGILGGAAEADPQLARRVNLDATLDLFEAVYDAKKPPRIVFASSIAVFGPPLPPSVDDDTHPVASMVYGAQKRMIEVALEQATARGWIDGYALRLPGIVARADADARLKSAFFNTMFFDFAAGKDIKLPVGPDGTTWLISVPACVEAFLHAGQLSAGAGGRRRAFTLPAQRVRIADLIAGLSELFPQSRSHVTYEVDDILHAQFATQPALETRLADDLGFKHDGSIDALIANAMRLKC